MPRQNCVADISLLCERDFSSPILDRAGIVPVYFDEVYGVWWLGICVNKNSQVLVSLGGSYDEECDYDLLSTAVREFQEETSASYLGITVDNLVHNREILLTVGAENNISIIYPMTREVFFKKFPLNCEIFQYYTLTLPQFHSIIKVNTSRTKGPPFIVGNNLLNLAPSIIEALGRADLQNYLRFPVDSKYLDTQDVLVIKPSLMIPIITPFVLPYKIVEYYKVPSQPKKSDLPSVPTEFSIPRSSVLLSPNIGWHKDRRIRRFTKYTSQLYDASRNAQPSDRYRNPQPRINDFIRTKKVVQKYDGDSMHDIFQLHRDLESQKGWYAVYVIPYGDNLLIWNSSRLHYLVTIKDFNDLESFFVHYGTQFILLWERPSKASFPRGIVRYLVQKVEEWLGIPEAVEFMHGINTLWEEGRIHDLTKYAMEYELKAYEVKNRELASRDCHIKTRKRGIFYQCFGNIAKLLLASTYYSKPLKLLEEEYRIAYNDVISGEMMLKLLEYDFLSHNNGMISIPLQ
jgi:hypothetical protein